MFQLDSYVFFDGTCADAMHFYQQTLGGEIEMMMTQGQSPNKDQVPVGGKVTMPLADTFWSEVYGMLVDRFGTPWMVSGGAAKSLA